jgi:hypothetical protein
MGLPREQRGRFFVTSKHYRGFDDEEYKYILFIIFTNVPCILWKAKNSILKYCGKLV